MSSSRHLRRSLLILLLGIITPILGSVLVPSVPAAAELDLVFPTNETYQPLAYFPIVFTIQGIDDIWPLELILRWSLYKDGTAVESDVDMIPPLSVRGRPDGGDVRGVFVNGTRHVANTTASWKLDYAFGFQHNCTMKGSNGGDIGATFDPDNVSNWPSSRSFSITGSIEFSTSPGGSVPEFQTDESCPVLAGTFEVAGLSTWSNSPLAPLCPVIAEKSSQPAHPCGAYRRESVGPDVTKAMNLLANCTNVPLPNLTGPCKSLAGLAHHITRWGVLAPLLVASSLITTLV